MMGIQFLCGQNFAERYPANALCGDNQSVPMA